MSSKRSFVLSFMLVSSVLHSKACRLNGECVCAVCSQQIQFGLMSPSEIVKASELQVYERSLYKVW